MRTVSTRDGNAGLGGGGVRGRLVFNILTIWRSFSIRLDSKADCINDNNLRSEISRRLRSGWFSII